MIELDVIQFKIKCLREVAELQMMDATEKRGMLMAFDQLTAWLNESQPKNDYADVPNG